MNKQNGAVRFLLIMLVTMLAVSVMLLAACGSGSNTTSATTSSSGVSFTMDIQPIFNNYCVVCHAGAGQAGLTLEPNLSHSDLVGVPSTQSAAMLLVKAGSPDQSYLLAKLNGTQLQAGGSGVRMPQGAGPLSQVQINLIQQWITEGARNN
jgi:hypothetical protein